MSINIDYHNVKRVELLPIKIRTLSSGQEYCSRRIIIHIDDAKHSINLFGAELDSLDVSPDKTEGSYERLPSQL